MKVAVLSVSWPMETFIERLLVGLSTRGLEVSIVSQGRPPTEWLRRHKIEWTFGPGNVTPRALTRHAHRNGLGPAMGTIRAELEAHTHLHRDSSVAVRPDVIYVPWINTLTDQPSLIAGDTPVVTSCRGRQISITPWSPLHRVHRDALPLVFSQVTLVHCVSEAIRDEARALGMDLAKARVITPAVDPDIFTPRTGAAVGESPLKAIAVGTLVWRKNYEHALVALRKVRDRGVDLHLDLVGDGPDRQHLTYVVQDLGLQDHVQLLGRLPAGDVARHVQAADVFIHTSSSEGISNAVLEAMATGLPVVTTDSGGMSEAVRHGIDGIVVGLRDADATADALVDLASDPARRSQMGSSGRSRVLDRFRLDQQLDAFVDMFHEAVGR
ncbi:MAG: glycosyltransferase family 4 protein [Acidimicrobiales bacterium]|nr:glycosyltransferase family 4 protein [Acidimicrobiales bacterium]